MSNDAIGGICVAVVFVAFFAYLAFDSWVKHK